MPALKLVLQRIQVAQCSISMVRTTSCKVPIPGQCQPHCVLLMGFVSNTTPNQPRTVLPQRTPLKLEKNLGHVQGKARLVVELVLAVTEAQIAHTSQPSTTWALMLPCHER